MLRASIGAGLGALFVVLGAMNVWLIFHASRRLQYRIAKCPADACALVGGYVFILLFCVMTYFMLLKIEDTGSLRRRSSISISGFVCFRGFGPVLHNRIFVQNPGILS